MIDNSSARQGSEGMRQNVAYLRVWLKHREPLQCWDFSRSEKETHNQPDKRIARHHNAQGIGLNGDNVMMLLNNYSGQCLCTRHACSYIMFYLSSHLHAILDRTCRCKHVQRTSIFNKLPNIYGTKQIPPNNYTKTEGALLETIHCQ